MNLKIPAPDIEAINRIQQERKARRLNPNERESLMRHTTTLSLWLDRCRAAGVPFVPAKFSPDVLVDDIMAAVDGGECPTVKAAAAWLDVNYTAGTMWRWEQCASWDLKSTMAHGGTAATWISFSVDDPRMIDILFDVNVESTRLAVRPVIPIVRHADYPVEFRCFVFDLNQVAITSYYPQRPLPQEIYHDTAVVAGELARKLFPVTKTPYSADFCLAQTGEILFLEGGPPWGYGSHPCCFNPDNVKPGRLLLAPEQGAVC